MRGWGCGAGSSRVQSGLGGAGGAGPSPQRASVPGARGALPPLSPAPLGPPSPAPGLQGLQGHHHHSRVLCILREALRATGSPRTRRRPGRDPAARSALRLSLPRPAGPARPGHSMHNSGL